MAEGYDHHFLVLAPGLQSAWFFQAARQYWQRFQPVVTDDVEIISYTESSARIAVTLLARPDTAVYVRERIQAQRGDVFIDLIVTGDLPTMESVLNERAENGEPFG